MFKTQKLKSKLKPNKSKSKVNIKLSKKKTHKNRKKNNNFSKIKKMRGGLGMPCKIKKLEDGSQICKCKRGFYLNSYNECSECPTTPNYDIDTKSCVYGPDGDIYRSDIDPNSKIKFIVMQIYDIIHEIILKNKEDKEFYVIGYNKINRLITNLINFDGGLVFFNVPLTKHIDIFENYLSELALIKELNIQNNNNNVEEFGYDNQL